MKLFHKLKNLVSCQKIQFQQKIIYVKTHEVNNRLDKHSSVEQIAILMNSLNEILYLHQYIKSYQIKLTEFSTFCRKIKLCFLKNKKLSIIPWCTLTFLTLNVSLSPFNLSFRKSQTQKLDKTPHTPSPPPLNAIQSSNSIQLHSKETHNALNIDNFKTYKQVSLKIQRKIT